MSEVWYDNRPYNSISRRYRRLVYGLIAAVCGLATPLMFLLFLVSERSIPLAATTAVLIGGGVAVTSFAVVGLVESGMPVEVSFRANELAWRVKRGGIRKVAYSDVLEVSAIGSHATRRMEMADRYVVAFAGWLPGTRRFIWLGPENEKRLDEALRTFRSSRLA